MEKKTVFGRKNSKQTAEIQNKQYIQSENSVLVHKVKACDFTKKYTEEIH